MCIQFELNIMICSTISLTFSTPNAAFLTSCKWFFFFFSLILFHGVWSILCCSLVLTQLDLQIRERHFGMHVRGTQSVLFLKKNNHQEDLPTEKKNQKKNNFTLSHGPQQMAFRYIGYNLFKKCCTTILSVNGPYY